MKIAFIGGGNMASALIGGLLTTPGRVKNIQVADPDPRVRAQLQKKWPVSCFEHATEAITGADVIVLAIKPQIVPAVLSEIGDLVAAEQLIISIVAGIPVSQIAAQLTSSPAIIRTMPNTPALIGLGVTALNASEGCSPEQHQMAQELMQAVGETVWLDQENLLDVVTAVSGSGPAYFFFLIEAMRAAAIRLGLPPKIAGKLALHTANGASAMALQSDVDVVELRRRVTSSGGTTQAALEQLEKGHFADLVDAAITTATRRGQELAGNRDSI